MLHNKILPPPESVKRRFPLTDGAASGILICKQMAIWEAVSLSKYMTRQRKALLDYLLAHADELLSAQEIADALSGEGVSLSAVYRNLAELEAEGRLRRAGKGGSREVYYQFTDADGCKGRMHLQCKRCGRTFHMDAAGAEQLKSVLERSEGFALDKGDTVLYGVCEVCRDD